MKSSIRLLLTICVSFLLMMVAGCGSDKYSGTWIQTLDSLHEGTVVRQVNIEKNGENYLCSETMLKFKPDPKSVLVNNDEFVDLLEQRYVRKFKNDTLIDERSVSQGEPAVDFTLKYERTYRWDKDKNPRQNPLILKDGMLMRGNDAVYVYKDGQLIDANSQIKFVESSKDREEQVREKIRTNMLAMQGKKKLGTYEDYTHNGITYQFFDIKRTWLSNTRVNKRPINIIASTEFKFEEPLKKEEKKQDTSGGFAPSMSSKILTGVGIAAGVLVLAVIALAFAHKRKKGNNQAQQAEQNYGQPPAQPLPQDNDATKFCVECGAEIPKDATFCPECGAEQ